MKRIWRNYDERYQVSNFGEVKSVERYVKTGTSPKGRLVKERILKPQILGSSGYKAVYIFDPELGKQKWHYVHRLVAECFIPNPENLPQINHKDEDKLNNRVDNLEWCDKAYNVNYGTAIARTVAKGRETKIKKGIWKDYSGMSEEEIKAYKRERNRKRYQPKYDRTVHIYKIVMEPRYVLIATSKNASRASEVLKCSPNTINKRLKEQSKQPINGFVVTKDKIAYTA